MNEPDKTMRLFRRCPKCLGKGNYPIYKGGYFADLKTCPKCKGKGRIAQAPPQKEE